MHHRPRISHILAAAFFLVCALAPLAGHGAGMLTPATVVRVHDGDTITVRLEGRTERVRLIGIDSPEVEVNQRLFRQIRRSRITRDGLLRLGREARDYARGLVPPGTEVGLQFDAETRDRYGRLLAYVYIHPPLHPTRELEAKEKMLNAAMVEEGLAWVYTVPPNTRHVRYFHWLEDGARRAGLGLWADAPPTPPRPQRRPPAGP